MTVTVINRVISSLFSNERGEATTPLLVALGIAGFAATAYFIFGALDGGEEVDSAQASYEQPECAVNLATCDCGDFDFDSSWATWFLTSYDRGNTHRLDSDGDGLACEEGAEKLSAP